MQQLSLTSSLARLSKLQKDPLIILIPFFELILGASLKESEISPLVG